MRARGMASPDEWDVVVLTSAEPVAGVSKRRVPVSSLPFATMPCGRCRAHLSRRHPRRRRRETPSRNLCKRSQAEFSRRRAAGWLWRSSTRSALKRCAWHGPPARSARGATSSTGTRRAGRVIRPGEPLAIWSRRARGSGCDYSLYFQSTEDSGRPDRRCYSPAITTGSI